MPKGVKPQFLKAGDQVAIVCTASSIRGGIQHAVDILKSWDLEVKIGKTVHSIHHQYGGSDQLRASDLQEALDNPSIKAIFAARGGYGTVRIIDEIDFSLFSKNPKWIVGYSDVTVLHSHIQACFNIPTVNGQMPKNFENGTFESINSLKKVLFGLKTSFSYPSQSKYLKPGKAEGILTGGNLAILNSLIGSKSEVDTTGKILFIEDVGEKYYNIDRMLWTLKRAKRLDDLAGLIVGSFTGLQDSDPSFGSTIEEIILEKFDKQNIPIAFDFPAGHIDNNRPLVFGSKVRVEVTKDHVNLIDI